MSDISVNSSNQVVLSNNQNSIKKQEIKDNIEKNNDNKVYNEDHSEIKSARNGKMPNGSETFNNVFQVPVPNMNISYGQYGQGEYGSGMGGMPQVTMPTAPGASNFPVPPPLMPGIIPGPPGMGGNYPGQPEQPLNNFPGGGGDWNNNIPQFPMPNIPGAPGIPIPGQGSNQDMSKVYQSAVKNRDSFTLFNLAKIDRERNVLPNVKSSEILYQSYDIAIQKREAGLLLEIAKYEFINNLMPTQTGDILNNSYTAAVSNRDSRTLYRIADFEAQVNVSPLRAEDIRDVARQIELNYGNGYPNPNYPYNNGNGY